MSEQAMGEFLAAADKDKTLADAFTSAIADNEGPAVLAAIASVAQSNGFDVTVDDVEAVREKILAAQEAQGELSDEQLENVAGGEMITVGIVATTLVIGAVTAGGLTVGGALAHSIADKGFAKVASNVGDFFKKW